MLCSSRFIATYQEYKEKKKIENKNEGEDKMKTFEDRTMERIRNEFDGKYGVIDFGINGAGGFNLTYSNGQTRTVDKCMLIDLINAKYRE